MNVLFCCLAAEIHQDSAKLNACLEKTDSMTSVATDVPEFCTIALFSLFLVLVAMSISVSVTLDVHVSAYKFVMSSVFLSLATYPSLPYTHTHTLSHAPSLSPPSPLLCAPQVDVCDAGVQYEGSKVPAGGAGCTSLWFPVLPESHGGTGGQYLPRPGTQTNTDTHIRRNRYQLPLQNKALLPDMLEKLKFFV